MLWCNLTRQSCETTIKIFLNIFIVDSFWKGLKAFPETIRTSYNCIPYFFVQQNVMRSGETCRMSQNDVLRNGLK